jgi:hypothetical protein
MRKQLVSSVAMQAHAIYRSKFEYSISVMFIVLTFVQKIKHDTYIEILTVLTCPGQLLQTN